MGYELSGQQGRQQSEFHAADSQTILAETISMIEWTAYAQ